MVRARTDGFAARGARLVRECCLFHILAQIESFIACEDPYSFIARGARLVRECCLFRVLAQIESFIVCEAHTVGCGVCQDRQLY